MKLKELIKRIFGLRDKVGVPIEPKKFICVQSSIEPDKKPNYNSLFKAYNRELSRKFKKPRK